MRLLSVISVVLLTIISSLCNPLAGQFVPSGGVPAKTKWMQAKGENYKVVYPHGMDSLALRYLWLLEQNRKAVMLGLGEIEPAKLPVVLYNGTVRSNGRVVWAPKRMELYTMPYRNGYAQRWEEQLAVHESRHVGQMTFFTKGIYKFGSILIGQQAPSLGVGIYPSRWMLEGDAVVAETELSNSGRGRSAEFLEYYRASFLEGDERQWERWKQNSYKYYTPDRYAFGYLLNSTIRYKTGNYDYAGEVFDQFIKNFYTPFARDISYRKVVDEIPRRYFRQGKDMMTAYWEEELTRRGKITEPAQMLLKRRGGYQEYLSPVQAGKDSILYLRHSFNEPAQLVLLHSGKEKVLRRFASNVDIVRYFGGNVYFIEQVANPLWSNEAYGVLYRYNLKDGVMKRMSGRNYYGNLQMKGDGSRLSVVEHFPNGGCALVVMDPLSGAETMRIPAPYNGEISGTAWVGDEIYALVVDDRGLGLFRLRGKEWETVIGEQSASIASLNSTGDSLYFVSDMDGVRNIYMYTPSDGRLARLTNDRYGAGEPLIYDGVLYYSSLELGGKFPVSIPLGSADGCGSEYAPSIENGRLVGQYRYFVADELSAQARKVLEEKGLLATDELLQQRNGTSIVKYSVSEEDFASGIVTSRYRKLGHLFRFHSWAPLYYNVDKIMESDYDNLYEVVQVGATAYSQNTLGTAVTMLGYSYRDGLHAGHFKMKYSGGYPFMQISADVNHEHRYRVRLERKDNKVTRRVERVDSPFIELSAIAYLPLNLSSHGWSRGLVPQVNWDFNNNGHYDYSKLKYVYSNLFALSLQYYQMTEVPHSAIFPKWGFGGIARWRAAIGGGENFGDEVSLHLYGYLPGFAPLHGVKWGFSVQKQNVEGKNYYLSNMVKMPRGYSEDVYGDVYRMASADYVLPVYLGDTQIFRLVYMKRMQIIPFADYAVCRKAVDNKGSMASTNLYSCGTAVLFDFAPFSIGLDVSLGVQYSYNGNNGNIPVDRNTFKVLVTTSLF